MMREIVWKEWRENRGKYLTLWLVFNLPIAALSIALAVSRGMRTPFADLSDQTFMKYLPLALFASPATVSLFLFATGFAGVATFLPELEHQSVFFAFEQPLARWRYAVAKLAAGGAHVALAVLGTSLLTPLVVYGMILTSGKVTVAASGGAFGTIMAGALRAGLWCALVSVAAYAGCALIATVIPRWWLAMAAMFVFVLFFANAVMGDNRFFNGEAFFDLFEQPGSGTYSASAGFGSWNWLTVSAALPPPTTYAHWRLLPTVTPIALTCLFAAGIAWMFERKELK